jgi:hypothetical protein
VLIEEFLPSVLIEEFLPSVLIEEFLPSVFESNDNITKIVEKIYFSAIDLSITSTLIVFKNN